MLDLTSLFCSIDDFVKTLSQNEGFLISKRESKRGGIARMSLSEMMTIIVMYHSSGFKNFKYFFISLRSNHVQEFPNLLSYTRFVDISRVDVERSQE